MRPGNACASVANIGIDKNHNGQYASHLRVRVAGGDHLEDIVVEVVQEGIQIFLGYFPQLSRDIAEDGRLEQAIWKGTCKLSELVGDMIQHDQATALT